MIAEHGPSILRYAVDRGAFCFSEGGRWPLRLLSPRLVDLRRPSRPILGVSSDLAAPHGAALFLCLAQ